MQPQTQEQVLETSTVQATEHVLLPQQQTNTINKLLAKPRNPLPQQHSCPRGAG